MGGGGERIEKSEGSVQMVICFTGINAWWCYDGIRPGEAFPQVKVSGRGNGKGCGDDADRVKYAGGG
jgi:hypothetical protein